MNRAFLFFPTLAFFASTGLAFLACSGSHSGSGPDGGTGGATVTSSSTTTATGTTTVTTGTSDSGLTLASCPMGLQAAGPCHVLTPIEEGASDAGYNAGVYQPALEPTGTAKGVLLLLLNGSMGTPAAFASDPVKNLYNAGASKGYHVLGLAYRSGEEIGTLCAGSDPCFLPSRETIVYGTLQDGSAPALDDIRSDESILWRLDAALEVLAAARPGAGWDAFRTTGAAPASRIVWSKILAAGHSQGGGHAALLGKLYPVAGVFQLSSTCDAVGPTPATWTSADAGWVTPSSTFLGLSVPTLPDAGSDAGDPLSDNVCVRHFAVWQNMAMQPANMHDDAMTCAGVSGHEASIDCPSNYADWLQILP